MLYSSKTVGLLESGLANLQLNLYTTVWFPKSQVFVSEFLLKTPCELQAGKENRAEDSHEV